LTDERLALLRELERADGTVGAELEELDELYASVAEVRGRAVDLQELFARLPEEREAAAQAVQESEEALADAQESLRRAEEELAASQAAGDAERIAAARRFEVRARDHLHIAERKADSAREHASELEAWAQAGRRETAELEGRARELTAVLEERPGLADAAGGPGMGPEGVAEWGTQARAALLVARSQLAAERDAVVRQANELGTVLLGEAIPPTSAAAVTRRVERELEDG
jgi:DNA repair exonuclease SbcCD ATPase subunit